MYDPKSSNVSSGNSSSMSASALIGLASTLASVGGQLIGGSMTNKRMRAAQRRQQQYSLELMEKAQQYNIENFNLENDYNTPLAQRERMKEAGLNPNFVDGLSPVVGQMDSVANGQGAPGQVSPYNLGNIGEIANAAATFASIKRDNKLAESQMAKNNADIKLAESNAYKADSEGAYYDTQNRKSQEVDIPLGLSQMNVNDSIMEDLWSQMRERNAKIDIGYQELDNLINRTSADIDLIDENINNMRELREMAWKELGPKIDNLNADTQAKIISAWCAKVLAQNDTARVGIERDTQRENARHNRVMELRAAEANAIQKSLNDYVGTYYTSLTAYTDQQSIGQYISNIRGAFAHAIDSALLKSGYTGAMYRVQYEKMMREVDNLIEEKELTKARVKEIEHAVMQKWAQIGINGFNAIKPSNGGFEGLPLLVK